MSLKKGLSVSMATVMSIGMVASNVVLSEAATEEKIIGSGRHETAVKISQKGWKNAENAIIVNDSAIADALAATPFAKNMDAPILLTSKNSLNSKTEEELKRLGVKNIYLIGGEAVLPIKIEESLLSEGYNVERIKGITREETAIKIAEKLSEKVDVKEIAVVNGTTGLADAVSVSSAAAQNDMAIILANKKDGINASKNFIKEEGVKKSYVIGGEKAISKSVYNALPNPERISGGNRNITNAKVINKFYNTNDLNSIYVAKNGSKSPSHLVDALAVGVLAAKEKSPVLIASNELTLSQKGIFNSKKFGRIIQVGGNGNENAFAEANNIQNGNIKTGKRIQDIYCQNDWYDINDNNKKIVFTKDTFNGYPCKVISNSNQYKCIFEVYEGNNVKKYKIDGMTELGVMFCKYNEEKGKFEPSSLLTEDPMKNGFEKCYGTWINDFNGDEWEITADGINGYPYEVVDSYKEDGAYVYVTEIYFEDDTYSIAKFEYEQNGMIFLSLYNFDTEEYEDEGVLS